jgi:hypothetical protein
MVNIFYPACLYSVNSVTYGIFCSDIIISFLVRFQRVNLTVLVKHISVAIT